MPNHYYDSLSSVYMMSLMESRALNYNDWLWRKPFNEICGVRVTNWISPSELSFYMIFCQENRIQSGGSCLFRRVRAEPLKLKHAQSRIRTSHFEVLGPALLLNSLSWTYFLFIYLFLCYLTEETHVELKIWHIFTDYTTQHSVTLKTECCLHA